MDRSKDWLSQAGKDLDLAKDAQKTGHHEWACFACHQAAEKAIKALHLYLKQETWGHVLVQLMQELPPSTDLPSDLIERGRVLDNFYIPTRYPNGHPDGAPFEHYGSIQSDQAILYASEIIEFIRFQMA